ncbi:MAG: oxygenase MpaB family protein [Gammaproteobacteria bacterium]
MKPTSILPGTSPFPPLSAERIAAAREKYGDAVDRYLEHLRIGDPLADELVLYFETLPRGEDLKLLTMAIDQGIDAIENPPAPLVALFKQLDHVPFWVDWERMRHASAKACQNGFLVALAFAAYALPHSYLATANKPLAFTGQLLDATAQRYARTARFVLETFYPKGLQRDADGFKWAVLMRITHARARRQLLQSGKWDIAALGIPLNQAHMALNTVFFSFYVLRGMQRMGVRFTRQEIESVLLIWRYVGYLFDIDPEMICTSEEEAQRLVEVAFSLEFDPDENSKKLCCSMMEAGPAFMKMQNKRLEGLFIKLVYTVSRHLLGDRMADRFGFPQERNRLLRYAFLTLVRFSEWFPYLVPQTVRAFMGISLWLEVSDYDSVPLAQKHEPVADQNRA